MWNTFCFRWSCTWPYFIFYEVFIIGGKKVNKGDICILKMMIVVIFWLFFPYSVQVLNKIGEVRFYFRYSNNYKKNIYMRFSKRFILITHSRSTWVQCHLCICNCIFSTAIVLIEPSREVVCDERTHTYLSFELYIYIYII